MSQNFDENFKKNFNRLGLKRVLQQLTRIVSPKNNILAIPNPPKNINTAMLTHPMFPFVHNGFDIHGPHPYEREHIQNFFGDRSVSCYDALPLPDQTADLAASVPLEHRYITLS